MRLYLLVLLPLGITANLWAIYGFSVEKVSIGLVTLAVVTIFFSSYLRIPLPRTKLYLTISDALVFLSLLVYGGEVAIILAALEAGFSSVGLRRPGTSIVKTTVLINILIAAFSVLVTALIIELFFFSTDEILQRADNTSYISLLAVMALSQFAVNTLFASQFIAIRTERKLWTVWNDYCFNALVLFCSGAAMAGLAAKALNQVNMLLFLVVTGFFALVYLTYRRYTEDVIRTAAQAEHSERRRAEQAENHLAELEHYVGELEKSGEALHESREKFRYAAYHDVLTGLPNRNYIIEALRVLLEGSRNGDQPQYAVLFLDLNRFRMINDSLGHATGDRILREVAKRISEMLAEGDLAGKFGGDEFVIVLKNIGNADEATTFANKVARRIAESVRFKDREVYTSVSIGIAFGSSEYKFAEDMLRDADIAMYHAKDYRKNSVIFDKTMRHSAVLQQQVETDLRYAIVCNELEVFYQPIVRLADTTLCGFEALVRWNHPRRGLISPNDFISVAEATGLIIPMTTQILKSSCAQFVEWEKKHVSVESMMLSVNISATHLADSRLADQIRNIIAETGIKPSSLKLELTETAVMENAERAITLLQQIKATGVSISIDDFGTGYSSLSYLHRLPLDYLKIDRSFINAMEDGSENQEIVRTIVALAKALKLSLIAEGIETAEQLERLRDLGCEFGQGYLFSRPLPADQIEKIIEGKRQWQVQSTSHFPYSAEPTAIEVTQ